MPAAKATKTGVIPSNIETPTTTNRNNDWTRTEFTRWLFRNLNRKSLRNNGGLTMSTAAIKRNVMNK